MKVTIPESIEDITLRQLQEITKFIETEGVTEADIDRKKIQVITGIDLSECSVSQTDYEDLLSSINKALEEPADFNPRFKMNGVEFGFHPNLDKMSTNEYVDLMTYHSNTETLHKLMAILFRPITGDDKFGNYKIANYKGTDEMCEYMRDTPLSVVNGALFFFLNLSRELRKNIQRYSSLKELRKGRKHQLFGLNGVGMQPS